MPTVQHIFGIDCTIPDAPRSIEGAKRKPKDQYFRRTEQPGFMEDIEFDSSGDPVYAQQQKNWIYAELDKIANGHFIMKRGVAVWLPGVYYYWLNYWTLEDGTRPEYRECDRLFFIFLFCCYQNPLIAAVIRGKARREGATSHGTCFEVWLATAAAGMGGNKRIGNISKTGDDVDDLFKNMVVYAFKALPVWLRPRTSGGSDPKKGLEFMEEARRKVAKGVADTSRQGLNSIITTRDTTLNAYDSGRWSFVLVDEGGKWLKVNIGKYWRILKDTLVKGASRVGFAYLPSTVNPPNQGGDNFKKLWFAANQFEYPLNRLPQQMVKYFKPAYDGLNGFIDQYGDSVIEPPDAETLKFLRYKNSLIRDAQEKVPDEYLSLGAGKYLELRLALLTDPEDISEEKRKYPTREADMFDFGDIFSPFNLDHVKEQMEHLRHEPVFWRRGRLIPHTHTDDGVQKFHIRFHDDSNGQWLIKKLPKQENAFSVDERGIVRPLCSHLYGGGVDTFRFDKTKELGSKGVIMIGEKLDVSKEDETGDEIAYYIGRPKLTELFWKEMLMGALFYGCTLTTEKDATQEYLKYFKNLMPNLMDANCLPMLGKKPDITIDTTRKASKDIDYGVSSADPFVFAKQIEVAQVYIQKYYRKITLLPLLEGLLVFDPSDRTSADTAIGWMLMLLNITGDFRQRKQETKRYPVAELYRVRGIDF